MNIFCRPSNIKSSILVMEHKITIVTSNMPIIQSSSINKRKKTTFLYFSLPPLHVLQAYRSNTKTIMENTTTSRLSGLFCNMGVLRQALSIVHNWEWLQTSEHQHFLHSMWQLYRWPFFFFFQLPDVLKILSLQFRLLKPCFEKRQVRQEFPAALSQKDGCAPQQRVCSKIHCNLIQCDVT